MYDIFEPNDRRLHEEAKAERAELESATLAVQELIVKLQQAERERDEAGDDARAAIRDALLLKEQAERERDEARKERDVAFEDLEQADKERGEWKNRYHTADTQALKLAEALRPFAEFSGPYPPELHAAAHRALAEWEKP